MSGVNDDLCACGRPLHYSNFRSHLAVLDLVHRLGPTTIVLIGGRRFRVQRHYIALHGLKAEELPGGQVPGAVEVEGPSVIMQKAFDDLDAIERGEPKR